MTETLDEIFKVGCRFCNNIAFGGYPFATN